MSTIYSESGSWGRGDRHMTTAIIAFGLIASLGAMLICYACAACACEVEPCRQR